MKYHFTSNHSDFVKSLQKYSQNNKMHFNVILFYFIYLAPVTCIKVYFNQQSINCWFIEKIFMNEYLTLKTNE